MVQERIAPTGDRPLVRSRLNALLQKGMHHPVTVVLAGPGYGKTQAVTDYVDRCAAKKLWMRLCGLDNLSSFFWNHLVRTARGVFPALAADLLALGFPDSVSKFIAFDRMLSKAVVESPGVIWVFDDFGEIHDKAIQGFFEVLMKLDISRFHLIIMSSNLVSTDSVAYMSSNQFVVHTNDLLFTRSEIAELYRINGIVLSGDEQGRIASHTGGWALPLRMLVQKHKATGTLHIAGGRLSEGEISDIFAERFFTQYTPAQQKLLLQLSLLGFFTKEFLVNLYEGPPEELAVFRNNVFIIDEPATDRYSFHGLYRIFLQKNQFLLDEKDAQRAWRNAAEYYMASGDIIEAITCYGSSGDHIAMLDALRDFVRLQHGVQAHGITAGNAAFFLKQLDLLTPEEVRQYPIADYFRALIYLNTLETDKAEALYTQLEQRLLADGTPDALALLGDVYAMTGALHMMRSQEDFGDYYEKAAQLLPNGTNLQNKSSLLMQNKNCFSLPDSRPGALERMERALHRGIPWANHVLCGGMSGLEHLYSAEAAFVTMRLEMARQHAYRAIYRAEPNAQHDLVCNGYFVLAKVAMMQGDLAEVQRHIQSIDGYAARYSIGVLKEIRDTALGWYYLRVRDVERVPRSIVQADLTDRAALACDRSSLVRALYVLLTKDCAKLVGMLENPVGPYMTTGIWQDIIARHIILAIAYLSLGNHAAAVRALWNAYEISHGNGITALFIEAEGYMPFLAGLARKQGEYMFAPKWLDRIEAQAVQFGHTMEGLRAAYRKQNPGKAVKDNPLSKREQEILQAVARGLTREEIAVEQYISVNTVKSTIRNIYNKLDANNKGDSVSIAISRGYIQGSARE